MSLAVDKWMDGHTGRKHYASGHSRLAEA